MGTEDGYARLAEAVHERRNALDLTQMEVAQLGGLSLDRVSAIERGEARNLRPKTIRSLERGLSWPDGTVRALLNNLDSDLPFDPTNAYRPARATPPAVSDGSPSAPSTIELTVIVNPDEPEPPFPPGGLQSVSERVIWALTDVPWQQRVAQIEVGRRVAADLKAARARAGDESAAEDHA